MPGMAETDDTPSAKTADMPQPGHLEQVSPLIRRRVAGNRGPFTATGTCTYVVGHGRVAVIDPGPDDPAHLDALLGDLAGETVDAILVTHTHRDHSPGARRLKAATGAPILGCGPHRPARPLLAGEIPALDASADREHHSDREMAEGDTVTGPGWTLSAVPTPGHTMNHLAFAFPEGDALFSGDHVMAWSTTVVAPPDGQMRAYMESLDALRTRSDAVYWPGHGGPAGGGYPRPARGGGRPHRRDRGGGLPGPRSAPAWGGGPLGLRPSGGSRLPRARHLRRPSPPRQPVRPGLTPLAPRGAPSHFAVRARFDTSSR